MPPEESAKVPYLMLPEGKARLFVPRGLCKDGPSRNTTRPWNVPSTTPCRRSSPIRWCASGKRNWTTRPNLRPPLPIIATTFRVTEHWQAGAMSRNLTWQSELMPEMFVEISPSLAKAKGVKAGDWVKVKSIRGASAGPGQSDPPGGPLHLRQAVHAE